MFWQWPHWTWSWSRICSQTSWRTKNMRAGSRGHSWHNSEITPPSPYKWIHQTLFIFCSILSGYTPDLRLRSQAWWDTPPPTHPLVTVAMLDNFQSTVSLQVINNRKWSLPKRNKCEQKLQLLPSNPNEWYCLCHHQWRIHLDHINNRSKTTIKYNQFKTEVK